MTVKTSCLNRLKEFAAKLVLLKRREKWINLGGNLLNIKPRSRGNLADSDPVIILYKVVNSPLRGPWVNDPGKVRIKFSVVSDRGECQLPDAFNQIKKYCSKPKLSDFEILKIWVITVCAQTLNVISQK